MTLSDAERNEIWGQVGVLKDNDACWLWFGPTKDGVGVFVHEGKRIPAHRAIYEIATGKEIPEGSIIRQSCGLWNCCNPRHLVEATRADSMRHASSKRRTLKPKANPGSKERRRRSWQMPPREVTIKESSDYDGDMAGFVRTLLPHDAMETQIEVAQALYEGKDVVIEQVGKRRMIYRLHPRIPNRGAGVLFVEPAPEWHGDVEQLCFSCGHSVPYHVPGRVQCQIQDSDSPTKGIMFSSDSCQDWQEK